MIIQNNNLNKISYYEFSGGTGLIRRLRLKQGVTAQNLASSVRVTEFNHYSEGLKADLVAEIALDVRAVVKKGDAELLLHRDMMNAVNNHNANQRNSHPRIQQAIFPEVMLVEPLENSSPDSHIKSHLMLMQVLAGYDSLDNLLYTHSVSAKQLSSIMMTVLRYCDFIHTIQPKQIDQLVNIQNKPDPFSCRISQLLETIKKHDPIISELWKKQGIVNGKECSPLQLVHGDGDAYATFFKTKSALISSK